jgi:RNA polymerase sigma-70 factor (ECF subfamily)
VHYGVGVPQHKLDDLVTRYLTEGDEEVAEEVVRRTRPRLLAAARRIGSPQDAEDAVHTAYLSLLHKRGGVLDAPIMPWLIRAVVRIAYRHKAQEQRHAELARRLGRAASSPGASAAAAQQEETERLRAGVDRLPPKYRDAVVLHYLEGLTTKEVASLLDASQAAVKKRLQRARQLLLGALAPWLAYPLLAVPWLLADTARASSTFVAGGVMKFKTAAMLATMIVAVGAVGVEVSRLDRGGRDVIRLPRRSEDAGLAVLLRELEATQEMDSALHTPSAGREAPPVTAPKALAIASVSAGRGARNRKAAGSRGGTIVPAIKVTAGQLRIGRPASGVLVQAAFHGSTRTQGIEATAQELSVGRPALDAARKAERTIRKRISGKPPPSIEQELDGALREFAAYGEEGYRAVIALLRSGRVVIGLSRLLRRVWGPGFERHLLAAARDSSVPKHSRRAALGALGSVDTPEVRQFLLDIAERSTDPGLFCSAASALGSLHEWRGARFVEDKLLHTGWYGVRPYLLAALGHMGGSDAESVLLRYIRNPRADLLHRAVLALNRINVVLAQEEAARILASPSAGSLTKEERRCLGQLAAGN